MHYKVEISDKAENDLKRISEYLREYKYNEEKVIKQINADIESLNFMPKIHKSLISSKDKYGEYRRIVSGNYVVIYKIAKDEIIILRIFNQKENYLNEENYMLKEESEKYILKKRRKINMIKFRTLKNSCSNLKESFSRIITGKEVWSRYIDRLIEEAEESLKIEGYITLEELREELIKEYNVNI